MASGKFYYDTAMEAYEKDDIKLFYYKVGVIHGIAETLMNTGDKELGDKVFETYKKPLESIMTEIANK